MIQLCSVLLLFGRGSDKLTSNYNLAVSKQIATSGSVLPKAGYSAFREPIPKPIYFVLPKITFVAD